MIRILKNKTADDANVTYANVTVVVEAGNQRDLAETFQAWQLAAIDDLVVLLGQGTDKFQLNDGASDLGVAAAIDLIRGYTGASQPVVLTSPGGSPLTATSDRLLVVNFPADFGSNLWLTSRGDDLVNQVRGRGPKLAHKFDDVTRTEIEEKSVEIQFMEQIQLHDGHIDIAVPANWDITTDEWELSVTMAANTVTPSAGGNTGNCNLVDMGGYNAIVPAAGDGAYDVDLATAVPLPSSGGGWDYDYFHDALTFPVDPASTSWALLDIPFKVFVQIAVNVPASPMGVFDFDAYDAQRISPRWKVKFTVRKLSNGPGSIAGWIVCFREQNT
jgi:hypothetical protein